MDPNERFRARRDQTRRTKRRRRAAVLAFLLLIVIAVVMGARFVGDNQATPASKPPPGGRTVAPAARGDAPAAAPGRDPRRPRDGRARVAVRASSRSTSTTSATASTRSSSTSRTRAARSDSRLADVPLARTVGANRLYYNPKALVALAHRNGIYMIGRVVCFQDPTLARERPDLAIQRPDGSVWTTIGRARLGQPLRPARLGLLRVRRAGRRRRRIRPDHVRLRPLPLRRRHRQRRLPGPDERLQGARDRRLRRIREEAARAERHEGLDRRLRPLGVARPRHRPGAALDLEVRRQHVADVLSRPLRRRRARPLEPEHPARRDGVPDADATSAAR